MIGPAHGALDVLHGVQVVSFGDDPAAAIVAHRLALLGATVWLLEPDAVITGQMLKVDAGFTLGRDRNQSR